MSAVTFTYRVTEFLFEPPYFIDHNHSVGINGGRPFQVETATIRENTFRRGPRRYVLVSGHSILTDGTIGKSTSRSATYALTETEVDDRHRLAPQWLLEALPEWAFEAVRA